MLIISLKALNQKQTLNNSLYKIKNNIGLSDKEKALFALLPMMDLNNKMEILKKIIPITQNINNLTNEEFEDMLKIQFVFAEKWKGNLAENGGADMVSLPKEAQDYIDNLLTKAEKEKLIEEGISLTAVNMLSKGFSLEDTSRATGLSMSKIRQLSPSK